MPLRAVFWVGGDRGCVTPADSMGGTGVGEASVCHPIS